MDTRGGAVDLDRYFERIGFRGHARPDLETLARLHELHTREIPFDGLSPFLGEPVALELDALARKLLSPGRGGYCFEQNTLFWRVLETLGFRVRGLGGRIRLNWPEDSVTPRGHMLLLVSLPESDYIADVGFGGLTLTGPLRLEPDVEQSTPHEVARLRLHQGLFALDMRIAGEWKTLYVFDLAPTYLPDYEIFNWYYAAHPRSPFVNGLILARPEPGRRHVLRDTRYSVYETGAQPRIRHLASAAEILDLLHTAFRITPPPDPSLADRLARLVSRAT